MSLMATAAGPWVIVGSIALGIGLTLFLLVRFAIPFGFKVLGVTPPWQPTPSPTASPRPTPTPHPLQNANLSTLQVEILFSEQYVSDIYRYGDYIYYTAGKDDAGGPRMKALVKRQLETAEETVLADTLNNDELFEPQVNDSYIVWLDHKLIGGGSIYARDTRTDETFEVKRYYAGKPRLTLTGSALVWTERTGTYMDKVYLFDLETRECVVLDMLENSPFGTSSSSANKDRAIWASYDPNASSEDKTQLKGAIYSAFIDGSGKTESYSPDMYVHDPKINGEGAIAWLDANHSEQSALYIKLPNGSKPVLIASGVTDYEMGGDFVAYTKDETLHVYIYGREPFDKTLTLDGERALLIGVSDDTVFWYHLGLGSKDIVKFVSLKDGEVKS